MHLPLLRRLGAAVLLALLVVPQAAASDAPITLKVGEVGEPLGLIAGIDRGFFAQEGITLALIPLSGGPALISATIGGSTDLNYGDVFAWSAAVSNGFSVQMFQPSNGATLTTLLVNPASGIKTAADLKGKQIGLPPTQLMTLETKLFLQHQGVDPSSVTLVPVTPYLGLGTALKGGHVDAIVDTDPFTQQAEKQYGFVPIGFPSREVPAGTSTAGYYATTAWLASHADVARRFARAYRRAAQWANAASPEQKAAVLAKYSPVNLNALEAEVPGIVKSFHYQVFSDGPLNIDVTQSWNDLAVKFGVLDKGAVLKDHLYPTATAAKL